MRWPRMTIRRRTPIGEAKGLEAAIDFILPAFVCVIGAVVTAPTLLPFLTLPVALWLLLKRAFGKPSWFKVSPGYYANIVLLAAIAAAIFAWPGRTIPAAQQDD